MIHRRRTLFGIAAALLAPAVIRTPGLLMPIKPLPVEADPRPAGGHQRGTIYCGAHRPAPGFGCDGDFYLDVACPSRSLYGPKAGGVWPLVPVVLKGPFSPMLRSC